MTWDDGALTADVVTAFTCSCDGEVTNHPIETGSDISDHVIIHPETVSVEFAQSEQPLARDAELEWKKASIQVRESEFEPDGLLMLTMAAGKALAAVGSALGLGGGAELQIWTLTAKQDRDRVNEVFDTLVDVWRGAKTVTITSKGRTLDGYIITSAKLTRSNKEAGLARITIEAQHVETVTTAATSLLDGFAVPAVLRALPLLDKGKTSTKAIEAAVVKRSIAAGLLDGLGLGL